MRISPSGARKISKHANASQEVPAERFGIEQSDLSMGKDELSKNFDPIGNLSASLQQSNTSAMQPKDDSTANDQVSFGGSIKIKQFIDKKLISLGVPERKLMEHEKRRFQYNKKKQSGFFEIPERTGSGDFITEEQVDTLCAELEENFSCDTDWNFAGGIYKVEFMPKKVEVSKDSLSSWDAGSQSTSKSALSKNSIIRESKYSILDALVAKGFGGK